MAGMKRFMPAFLFVLLLGALPLHAQHPARWGVRGGLVDGEAMIGGEMIFRLGNGFFFNPSVEISGWGVTTNADAHYAVELTRDAALYGGLGIAAINPKNQDLDAGVNVLVGVGVRRSGFILYTQAKRIVPSSGDGVNTFAFGVRF
jgi:hypothetical protein